jgi:BirA family biotin operon repressor/biotin-[acetyl-CoA-carboxylase] ligase
MWNNECFHVKLNEVIGHLKNINKIFVYEEAKSTNDIAHNLEKKDALSGTVIIAHKQTQGRGRLNRQWMMKEGDIALSIIIRSSQMPINNGLLPILPALAMTKALLKFSLVAKLKWPNDIVMLGQQNYSYLGHYKKLGGVLIENIFVKNHIRASIVGVGLNVVNNPSLYEQVPHAASIAQFCPTITNLDILINFLPKLDEIIEEAKADEKAIITQYSDMCVTLGHQVKINTSDGIIIGEAISINSNGYLVVFDGAKNHIITAGDVVSI